ncbi:expressed unknown protein [Seminavis robusta]|uniref:Uncharacterized protein n=1 Tax=Seminavis robusta TaxID=568900 RepID=A0A9N8EKC1_9STRA|nr:expressed unknown protein [Seminavis robusta]|eukprot:Sro1220_g253530.1 n/a (581) ;mRNA; f:13990-15732
MDLLLYFSIVACGFLSSFASSEDLQAPNSRRPLLLRNDNWRRTRNPFVVVQASSPRRLTSSLFDPLSYHLGSDPNDIDADFDPDFFPRPTDPDSADDNDTTTPNNNGDGQLPHTPVIYRYYSKRRSRTRASGSIPFILLGSNVDHWRTTGEHLAARGFSVIACEQDPLEPEENNGDEQAINGSSNNNNNNSKDSAETTTTKSDQEWWKGTDGEAACMISNLLQQSRWTKAVLVASDSEAILAIQAAYGLAPDKIAGLVLVGDLTKVESLLAESHPNLCQQEGNFAVDALLSQILPCPFAIAWDGEKTTQPTPSQYDGSSPAECLQGNRCFILGGGVAPHRRQPETFGWTLTRFVEDKVAPSIPTMAGKRRRRVRTKTSLPRIPPAITRFLSFDYIPTGSFVVYGRIVASALLYASMLKVGIYQYARFLDGMVYMKTNYDVLQSVRRKTVGVISGFFVNYGYIPLLFQRKGDEPELDPVEYVTELEADPIFENNTDTNIGDNTTTTNADPDETYPPKETEDSSETQDGGPVDEGQEPSEDKPEEKEEETYRFQPLFFLDRVVAKAATTPPNNTPHREDRVC